MATYIIFALVIVFLMAGSFFWMWKLSRYLVIPIQIALFILLMIVVVKVFVNRENATKLKEEVSRSGIPQLETKIVSASADTLRDVTNRNNPQINGSNERTATPAPAPAKKPDTPPKGSDGGHNFVDLL